MNVDVVLLMTVAGTIEYEVREVEMGVSDFYGKLVHRDLTRDLTRLPPRDSTLDGRWTRKPFGLSRVQPIYLSIPRPS